MSGDAELPVEGHRLKEISPRAWQHPADKAASAALSAIPQLDRVVRKLIELGYERALRQQALGSSVRLSEAQLSDVWSEHVHAYVTLDMGDPPPLYMTQFPIANAMVIGAKQPIVVVNSELVALLDPPQRRAVFAHEAAHILADHALYGTALAILTGLARAGRLPLPLVPIRTALLEWSRAAELSCDRGAALVTRDPLAVCRTFMSLAGGAMVDRLDLDAFMKQGLEYTDEGTGFERLTRLLIDIGVTHPLPVRRVHELMKWVQGGDYDRIVGGAYARRGEPAGVREESGEAVSFYAERFSRAFRQAGDAVGSMGGQLADWLRRDAPGDDG
jgi:Zn-dependent protease with chaperone function